MPTPNAQEVKLMHKVLADRLGVKPQDVVLSDAFLATVGVMFVKDVRQVELAGEPVCVADFLPGGDYEESGDYLCEAYLNWGRFRHEKAEAGEPRCRFPANEHPRSYEVMELYHHLPERVQHELRQHMETVLALWSEDWQPPFDSAESTLQAMEQCDVVPAPRPYPYALAWWRDAPYMLQVRIGGMVCAIRTANLSEPLSAAFSLVGLVADSACLNVADAAAFLLYGRKPEYPSFVAVLDPLTLTVHLPLPAWLSHPAVRAIWQAVHVNLHQQVATLYVTRWQMLPPPTATRLFHWWNQHAPAEWHYSAATAVAYALRRAEAKTAAGEGGDFIPDSAEPPAQD